MTSSPAFFPLARFSSLLGVHTTLLLFTAFYLPRSSFLLSPLPLQASSRDRPQHDFLRPLTADPQLTLVWLCAGVAVIQASWASWLKTESESARLAILGDDEEARVKRTLKSGQEKLQSVKDALTSTLASSLFIHIILVLFGAPFVGHFSKTYLLALLLSFFVVYPNVYILKSPSLKSDTNALVHRLTWLRLFAELSIRSPYERLLVYPTVGTLVGAWLAVFPVALDWDRPWQAWPLTPAFGAIVGHIVGSWASLAVNAILFLAAVDKAAEAEKVQNEAATVTTKTKTSGKSRIAKK
ncbi:hypothetical protein M0805_000787 [Coniferiporia weirii]|nr:hypothetical protein M0805_000787 [Coniferiporia weirii]